MTDQPMPETDPRVAVHVEATGSRGDHVPHPDDQAPDHHIEGQQNPNANHGP